ncbi:MAG: MBL fold metallo-hydrolase [Phycisphaeraceae bacterium]|nr:MBL fold metallo-hydrolase [Phycisphaeraceae bacterium]MCB9847966.1 MBL fold metallo-hydrolase [Phycisphaeraceae bacterium]
MHVTRRQFTRTSAAALASAAFAGPLTRRVLAQVASPVNWRRISDRARAIEGMGGNALIFAQGDDTLLIDTKIAVGGQLTRDYIQTGGYMVTQVINTHHHADHTGGNAWWKPDTPILAHELAVPRIRAQRDRYDDSLKRRDPNDSAPPIELFVPSDTTNGETELTIGDEKVILHHFGPGHTDNDIVVLIPGENLLHTGDLCFNKMHPFIDLDGGATTKGWLAAVEQCLKLCDERTIVVPGHGPVTNFRGLELQRDYFNALRETVARAVKEGRSREETYKLPIPGFEDYDSPRGQAMALSAAYIELTGKSD